MLTSQKMVVVLVMGVCGSGKTVVGQALAKEIGCVFADADDYHPETNVKKMQRGTPLNDEDRLPWLKSLNSVINKWEEGSAPHSYSKQEPSSDNLSIPSSSSLVDHRAPGPNVNEGSLPEAQCHLVTGVLACSALKQSYRRTLLNNQEEVVRSDSMLNCILILLQGSEETILSRLHKRRGHYMPASLLRSQLDTLEIPTEDETGGLIIIEDLTEPVHKIVSEIIQRLPNLISQSN